MKIGPSLDLYGKDPLTGKPPAAGNAKSSATPTTGSTAGVTTASLSSLSSTLAALEPELRAPEFDQAKVDAIKQAMREGKFEVNASVVAEKIINSAQELLARKNAN